MKSNNYNLRVRPPKEMRKTLEAGASRRLVTYRTYVKAVLTKAAAKNICFVQDQEKKTETVESRILLDKKLKPVVQKLAKQSKRSPEEWAIEVLKIHDQVLEK